MGPGSRDRVHPGGLTVDVDPLASMRCWAIEIELGGRVYDIPALPAVEWWPVLSSADLSQILDFVVSRPDDPSNLDDLLLSGALSTEDLVEALTDAIEQTAGRSYHSALVLAAVANSQWAVINGALVQTGFRWDDQPLGAALDAVYAVIAERMDKDDLVKFRALLDNESLTAGKRRGRNRQKALAQFEEMAGPRPTTGAVATGERSGSARPKTRLRPRLLPQDGQSVAPRRPRAPRAGSGPVASSEILLGVGEPASGTGLPPPL